VSHKKTITVGIDGKFFNIPTVIGGKTVGTRRAVDFAIKNRKLGKSFNNEKAALNSARIKSKIQGGDILPRKKPRRKKPRRKKK
tara:strand:+ start:5585 stop:5836 length:252 start_codon:yes stop_codon:yes gene_type:complete